MTTTRGVDAIRAARVADAIREGARRLSDLRALIYETHRQPDRRAEWSRACEQFHRSYDRSAFPGGLRAGMANLEAGDPSARDAAITFLEVDPMFFRSGYIKEKIIRRIKHFDLAPREIDRVHSAILQVVRNRWCRELRSYRTLARRLSDPRLKSYLQHLADGGDPEARKRAAWVLAGMEP